MTNAELNQLSISELRELNRKVVEMIKLKMQFEGKKNADNLQKGMIVKYKGSSDNLQGQKFVIEKISKVNAQCKSLRDNKTWNINLANIEPCKESVENEFFMNENHPGVQHPSNCNKSQFKTQQMKLDFTKLEGWELTKAIYLIQKAKELGMSLDGYGEIDVNPNSGYTYLWSEDYPFTLYMPINCELTNDDVVVMYTDFDNGDEIEKLLSEFDGIGEIYDWVKSLENCED